jgi:UDP-N-acetylmuramate dehydrogenase
MKFDKDISLADLTTFKISGKADYFCVVGDLDELKEAVFFAKRKKLPFFVLGGGSNILVSDNGFRGLVIKNEIKGIDWGHLVSAGAGEDWDNFVLETVKKNLSGLENLSGIPGTVGGAVYGNIGAYGGEIKNVLSSVLVFDTEKMETKEIKNSDCCFGYRESFFKTGEGKKFIIIKANFPLTEKGKPNIEYGDLKKYFTGKNSSGISIPDVRKAVLKIRKEKLPDIKKIGTAGSFFKNPVISTTAFQEISKKFPGMPSYSVGENLVKIPLAWVLDNVCKLNGISNGKVGFYEKQPLVIVAEKGASAVDVINFAKKAEQLVKKNTGIKIEKEIEFITS